LTFGLFLAKNEKAQMFVLNQGRPKEPRGVFAIRIKRELISKGGKRGGVPHLAHNADLFWANMTSIKHNYSPKQV
jgi:hypothetical protein